jgi:hypothetical protein
MTLDELLARLPGHRDVSDRLSPEFRPLPGS